MSPNLSYQCGSQSQRHSTSPVQKSSHTPCEMWTQLSPGLKYISIHLVNFYTFLSFHIHIFTFFIYKSKKCRATSSLESTVVQFHLSITTDIFLRKRTSVTATQAMTLFNKADCSELSPSTGGIPDQVGLGQIVINYARV